MTKWRNTSGAPRASAGRTRATVLLAGLLVAIAATVCEAGEPTVLLNFICASQDSALRVALAKGWGSPANMPADCLAIAGQRNENRMATILEIVEVLAPRPGLWVQVGRVRLLYGSVSYSAGFADAPPTS